MTQNRRIVLNIVATYGIPQAKRAAKQAQCGVRSVYGAVLGLFTAWWVLMSLGQIDYGSFGVVGGIADGRIAAKIW